MVALPTTLALQRQATKATRRVAPKPKYKLVVFTEGKEADAILRASPYLKRYTQPKMKRGTTVEKAVRIHTLEEFPKEWTAYAVGRENPKTRKPYTTSEAEADAISVGAFFVPETKEIHVNASRAAAKQWLHESLHLFSERAGWIDKVGYYVNEGVTELFTEMVCKPNKIPFSTNFGDELAAVKQLVAKFGESATDKLADAYFNGKLDGIKKAVDAKGTGTWEKWLNAMNRASFTEADNLLK